MIFNFLRGGKAMREIKYRLGLDMGATSIGWAVINSDTEELVNFGVRIFDDGREDKSKASLCVKRRNARGMRRLVNRRHIKIQELLKMLINIGLFPEDEKERKSLKNENPYYLRKKALDEVLTEYELGRVLLQLAKRKGFKSNRKDDKKEGGKLKKGYEELLEAMKTENARTYGEFLYNRWKKSPEKSIRLKNIFDETSGKFLGGLFPFREVYQKEFEVIWESQKPYFSDALTDENKVKIKDLIFFQRPLKEADEGLCQFEENEKRIAKAHPLFQEFRIWQNVLNTRFDGDVLQRDELQKLVDLLQNPVAGKSNTDGIMTYENIKKFLGLDKEGVFNYTKKSSSDADFEKGMLVDTTQKAINESQYIKPFWDKLSDEQKGRVINLFAKPSRYIDFPKRLSAEQEDNMIADYLIKNFGFSREAADELLYDIVLEDGYGSLSEKAIGKILPYMKEGQLYSDACLSAGYHHSDKDYISLDKLPYYGEILTQSCIGRKNSPTCAEERFGRINNATVHVALNQVRHLVNEIIGCYGKPDDIAIEYARDLNASMEERSKMSKKRDDNEKENKRILEELKKIGDYHCSKDNIQKYKIWERLAKNPVDRKCPFSGTPIGIEDLLNGQKFQIEHLLPFSRTFDNSLDNKVIATVEANRYKDNRTPFEAFGESKDGYNWKEIKRRANKLSAEQKWRFDKDAMQRFEENHGPVARSLNDTRYMTRLLQDYLMPIVREDGKKNVQSIAGALTAMVRKSWGLDIYKDKEVFYENPVPDSEKKDSDDESKGYRLFHNHHAIDAIVIASITRGEINKAHRELTRLPDEVYHELADDFKKLRDDTVPDEDKKAIKKKIKDFRLEREGAIIATYFKMPQGLKRDEIIDRVDKINISHKPNLKNIKDKNSTVGQLHEDTAYGFKGFVDDKSLKARFVTKGKDGKKEMIKDITDYIPMFYDKADKNAYYDAYKQWFIIDGKAKSLDIKGTFFAKTDLQKQECDAILRLRTAAEKAFKWFIGGNNFCAEIYQINPDNKICGRLTKDRGEWKSEIISNYNATVRNRRGENISYWRYKYPNAKRIMSLRRNDMVLATFTREQAFEEDFPKGLQYYVREKFNKNPDMEKLDILLRVKKMQLDGRISLTPHDIAKEEGDTKSFGAVASSLQKYNVRNVHVSFMGRIENAE